MHRIVLPSVLLHLTRFVCVVVVASASVSVHAQDSWWQWRGPGGQGHAQNCRIPTQFDVKDATWKYDVAGKGWSTPAVDSGMIWLTTAIVTPATEEETAARLAGDPLKDMKEVASEIELRALCLRQENGRVLHDLALGRIKAPDPINPLNTYASPSPVIDGDNVLLHFGDLGTWCVKMVTGEVVWQRRIRVQHSVGAGSSPFVIDDVVVLVCDGVDKQFVVALNKNTGREAWRTSRPPMTGDNVEFHKAYCTPIEVEHDGRKEIVIPGAQWICAYDPKNGNELWRVNHGRGFSVSPMPVSVDGMVIFSTGYMRPELVAVRLGGEGDVTQSHVAWRLRQGVPAKPSPLIVDGNLYMVSDLGVLSCVKVTDGSIVWRERLGGNFSASPILADGKLVFCSHEGKVTMVQPGLEYKELAQSSLPPRILASPVPLSQGLLIRTETSLFHFSL
ncbi:MAG TPA: serine/threonine protein kinase [Planctomycetaceae bacterium]|nr:serine/threonine protein kinase [Planctomycetaceae bacterium]